MDRLVIESILADVNEILISRDDRLSELSPAIILGFKANNSEQVIHAFTELKSLAEKSEISLSICKTMVVGMYDIEIKHADLDEPIRICNKVIANELLGEIEDYILKGGKLSLANNVSEEGNWVGLGEVQIKECSVTQD